VAGGPGPVVITPSLGLGTAQLGMPYGVARQADGVRPETAHDILRTALDLGIEYVDTAPSYGHAEAIVGEFLTTVRARVMVCTKTPARHGGCDVISSIRASVAQSCERLHRDTVDEVLIHSMQDLRAHGLSLIGALEELCVRGLVSRLGASIYDPEDVDVVLQYPVLQVTQLPFSVFNRTLVESGAVRRLRAAGHTIVVRSVVHQGLLMLRPDAAETAVAGAGAWVQRFRAVCERHGVPPLAAAVGYACARSGADRVVVGVDSAAQLREIATIMHDHLTPEAIADLHEELQAVPDGVADPRRWPIGPSARVNTETT
jgi:aryl-alcohol dehydrogenase-like predicted oxidoreductase